MTLLGGLFFSYGKLGLDLGYRGDERVMEEVDGEQTKVEMECMRDILQGVGIRRLSMWWKSDDRCIHGEVIKFITHL